MKIVVITIIIIIYTKFRDIERCLLVDVIYCPYVHAMKFQKIVQLR